MLQGRLTCARFDTEMEFAIDAGACDSCSPLVRRYPSFGSARAALCRTQVAAMAAQKLSTWKRKCGWL
jgi:hypothetical protein